MVLQQVEVSTRLTDSVSGMIGDIGLTAASITGGLEDGVSWVNGVATNLQGRIDAVMNFISGVANGLVADIKQLSKGIARVDCSYHKGDCRFAFGSSNSYQRCTQSYW